LNKTILWLGLVSAKVRAQIDGRLEKIRDHGHYGHVKKISSVLFEIKFNNGNRIYCTKKIFGKIVVSVL